ncbi:MAG: anaerobic ribonucleoside-triphosphate reductase [Acholeplasmataceae bacterium]|jgi:anaerobic ribonucleoside-triphosphate reductase/anaerobic ribonucleoside-triphosphate reductase activating protein
MIQKIRKRDGRYVKFNENKITEAIQKAILAVEAEVTLNKTYRMTKEVVKRIEEETPEGRIPTVESVQDIVEKVLMASKLPEVAKAYILYREERSRVRDRETRLMKTFQEIEHDKKTTSNFLLKRGDFHYENPTKSILAYGREGAKEYNKMFTINPEYVKMHEDGDIFIKEIEYYASSFNTLQINSKRIIENGIIKDNIVFKKANTIDDYLVFLSYIILKAESDIYGGIQIPDFDFVLAEAVKKNHYLILLSTLEKYLTFQKINLDLSQIKRIEDIEQLDIPLETLDHIKNIANIELEKELYHSLVKFLQGLKMMSSKNQSGIVNLSIAYGTDQSLYGRLVTKNILLATQEGASGHLYTTPVQIFKVKDGVNYNKRDPNYDLYQLAIETQALRMYPNFMFLDATANQLDEIDTLRELSYSASRNRIATNVIDYNQSPLGRGSLGETIINLPRVALNSRNVEDFYNKLGSLLNKVINQLLDKYKNLSSLKSLHLPFLMKDQAWRDSNSLHGNDNLNQVIKNGSLDVGFIGLAEALEALIGSHHGQTDEARQLGLDIIKHINELLNLAKEKYGLNFQLVASSKVDLVENFVLKDQQKYGIIKNVTDKSFYTDSFHIPSNYPINAENKIIIEAPYHALIPGGHITYIELGGEQKNKVSSIKGLLKLMKKHDIAYAAINHQLDFHPSCGFIGEINSNKCPKCDMIESLERPFFRYRRINDLLISPINLETFEHEEVDLRVTHINNLMRVSGFVHDSIVDGPGLRFVVFTQGCLIGCPGCHNPETWDPDGGTLVELDDIVKMWRSNPLIEGVTFSGGDPLLQPDKVLYLAKKAKESQLSIVLYSGRYYEELLELNNPFINEILEIVDILIDGPFVIAQLNLNLQYRGSENQRVIDLVKTRESGKIELLIV